MGKADSKERASTYCLKNDIVADFDNLLGIGQEGFVWRTSEDSAIKVFDLIRNFNNEFKSLYRLLEHGVTEIKGFTIPVMLNSDRDLMVIEMTIVAPPYLLDFGKAYIDQKPDFSPEVMEYYEAEREAMFEGNWPLVDLAVCALERFGIYYWDARPTNIDCKGHREAV